MTWAAPLWLLGLLPWSAVVLYLLWGRRRRTDVPFLDLWQGPAKGVRVRRRVSPPPLALALAVLAMLLAVLAAGRPEMTWPWGGLTVSVVIDRGYTMSARGQKDDTRVVDTVAAVEAALGTLAPLRGIERWVVPGPGPQRTNASDLIISPVRTPTALDTRDALRLATRAALARNPGPAIVVSDQSLGFDDERVVQVSPETLVRNARVVLAAARENPAVQVMVRVRGGAGIARGTVRRGTVRVSSAGASAQRGVELRADRDTDVFIDLPRLGDFLKAELRVDDDAPADDAAWLVREASWPRLEPRAPLPAHIQRMVEVYARSRPPGDASRRVILAGDAGALPPGEPGVVVAPVAGGGAGRAARLAEPTVREHPITTGVTWADVGSPALVPGGPPNGWAPVVSSGANVWVAVREQPVRAVWIGFETADWARSAEFVVFWANVFNWAGAGGERFASYPVATLEGDWEAVELAEALVPPEHGLWPGLYRRADGTLRALHAPHVPFPAPRQTDWRDRLARLARDAQGRLALAPGLSLLGLICLLLAMLLWKPRRRAVSQPRSTRSHLGSSGRDPA